MSYRFPDPKPRRFVNMRLVGGRDYATYPGHVRELSTGPVVAGTETVFLVFEDGSRIHVVGTVAKLAKSLTEASE